MVEVRSKKYRVQSTITAKLDVLDVTGRKISSLTPNSLSLGEGRGEALTFKIKRNGLAAGLYFYNVYLDEMPVGSGKLVIQD